LILAWVTFPAGGVYPMVWIPAACGVVLLALMVRPRIAGNPAARTADLALVLSVAAIVLQLVPLPQPVLRAIDPHALGVRASLWLMVPPADADGRVFPISINPPDTIAALGIVVCAVLFFWTCRQICEAGGAGRMIRAIAVIGLVASIAAIVQRSQSHDLLYGIWRPIDPGARPYGPFVNRNHFATWVVMACPLVFGYVLARAPNHPPAHLMTQRMAAALKQLGSMRIWLVASVSVMALAVLISASRSGLIGLMSATVISLLLRRGNGEPATRRWTIVQGVLLVVVALSFANFDALLERFDQTLIPSDAGRGRTAIWSDAGRVIRSFALTGSGAGTFGRAVAVYQTAEPGYSIGNAHNHYLQLAAEGGLLIGAPAALGLCAFLALGARRLREDASGDYLVRAGAAAGITAVLVQSFWETGLRMPANAMLLAVLAAIATSSVDARTARHKPC
jgi:hypothetical protein